MAKYFRLTATSIIRYEHYIKVPDSFTKEDIWELEGKDHSMYDGGMFSEVKYSGDWEFDDVHEYTEEEMKKKEEALKNATEYTRENLTQGEES
jgi:hypothetical protein